MDDCTHPDFAAFVDVHRLFDTDEHEADPLAVQSDSLAITVRADCSVCGKAVRFEGPVGVATGPNAPPMVSFDGTELRAAGHMGENKSRGIVVRMRTD